jgi:hypothetical protein
MCESHRISGTNQQRMIANEVRYAANRGSDNWQPGLHRLLDDESAGFPPAGQDKDIGGVQQISSVVAVTNKRDASGPLRGRHQVRSLRSVTNHDQSGG